MQHWSKLAPPRRYRLQRPSGHRPQGRCREVSCAGSLRIPRSDAVEVQAFQRLHSKLWKNTGGPGEQVAWWSEMVAGATAQGFK